MKKVYLLIATIFLNIAIFASVNESVKSARVTYIANSGFIVQVGDTKVMFDGIFQNGMNLYLEPDAETVNNIKEALPPFDDVNLVCISNYHADHFDPYLTTQFMLHNTEAKLICPQQVINRMMIFVADYQKIKNRIIESTPMRNQYDRIIVDGVEILTCNLQHDIFQYDQIENMAYVVNMNGVKLFHSGDTSPETLKDLKGIVLSDLNIDIAMLSDKYGLRKGAKLTNEIVDARYNVLMHFEKYITDGVLESFCERSKLTHKPLVFRVRNEYQDFFLNDFFMPNHNNEPLTLSQR